MTTGEGLASLRPAKISTKNMGVQDQIQHDDKQAEEDLDLMGESRGIDNGNEIIFDKTRGISFLPRQFAEMVFQGGKGTDIAGEFDIGPPDCSRQVQPGNPRPVQDEKTAGDNEDDERQVQEYDQIGEDSIEHRRQP